MCCTKGEGKLVWSELFLLLVSLPSCPPHLNLKEFLTQYEQIKRF